MTADIAKYVWLAKDLGMVNAVAITSQEVCFDIRALLKCRWGCEYGTGGSIKCQGMDTSFSERVDMVRAYQQIIIVHSHDETTLSRAVLEMERTAFIDGHYFAFAIRACHLCETCVVKEGRDCPSPEKVRPWDSIFGIDVYKTARNLGLPCQVLQRKEEIQNRFGFVLIE